MSYKRVHRFSLLLLIVFGFLGNSAFGQTEILVDNFSLMENDGEVMLTWVIKQGSLCYGVEIERSLDGENFEQVGRISGVCGNLDSPVRQDYVDTRPVLNRVNYYRLHSGDYIISPVIEIEVINLGNGGYVIKPNPIINSGQIYFDNPKHETFDLSLINQSGLKVFEAESFQEYFLVDGKSIPPGIYYFLIVKRGDASFIKGKLIVLE